MARPFPLLPALMALALVATSAGGASAEAARFTSGKIHVMAAEDLLGVTHAEIPIGQPLYLQISNSRAATAFVDAGMRIRLFRLTDAGQMVEWTQFLPCKVFLTTLWGPIARSGRAINLGQLDLSWLAADGRGGLRDGRWLLVFEDLSDDHAVLRVNESSVQRYRQMGLELVVGTGGSSYSQTQLRPLTDAEAQARREQMEGANRNTPELICVTLAETAPGPSARVASLDRCPRAAPDTDGASG